MILNLEPIKSDANCFANNLIIQVCNYYNIEYLPFFLRYFNDYLCAKHFNDDLFNSDPSISIVGKYPVESLIGFSYCEQYNKNDYKRFIISQLNSGVPVGLCIDGVNLQWRISDRSVDRLILIVGYDEDRGVFICADGYLSSKYQELKETEIYNGSSVLILNRINNFTLEADRIPEAILYNYSNDILSQRNNDMVHYDRPYHITI